MASVDKKVYRNSAIYTACSFVLKAMSFLLLPLYTRFLTPTDYGVMGLMERFLSVATVLSTFSLQAAVMRFYIDFRGDSDGMSRFVGTLVCFSLLSTLIFNALFVMLRRAFVPLLFDGISFLPTVAITLSGLFFTNVYGIYQQVLRGMERARASAFTSIAYLGLNIGFNLLFVVIFGMGAVGALLGNAAAGFCLAVFAVVHMMRLDIFRVCIDWRLVRELLAYSVPLMPHNLSTQIAQLVSGVLINIGGNLSEVGIYNVASKFGTACDTLQSSVSTAYQPWLFRMLKDRPDDYNRQIISYTTAIMDVYTLIFCALGLFIRDPILMFLGESYSGSWKLIPPIVLVYAAKSAYYFYIGVLFYHKKATRKIFVATVSSSLLNVIITFWTVPIWGAYGSVLADGLSMLVRVGLVVWMYTWCQDNVYRLRQFLVPFVTVTLVLCVGLIPCYLDPDTVTTYLFAWRLIIYMLLVFKVLIKHPNIVSVVVNKLSFKQRS